MGGMTRPTAEIWQRSFPGYDVADHPGRAAFDSMMLGVRTLFGGTWEDQYMVGTSSPSPPPEPPPAREWVTTELIKESPRPPTTQVPREGTR